MTDTRCNVYELNQSFLDALEFMDRVIMDRSKRTRRLWIDMIPRGAFELGAGIVRKTHKFHGPLPDQAALTSWSPVQISREPSGSDPGYDACRYECDTIKYGFETLQYTGHETCKRTQDICLKDIRYKWEFRQQLALIFSGLADHTLSVWENYAREIYLKYAADEGQIYIMDRGAPDSQPLSTTYDPFTSDEITIPRDIDISTLTWEFMEWWHQYYTLEAPTAAIGGNMDDPVFGLVIHPKDFDWMIRNDPDIREDYRYANAKVLIDNYGSVKEFKGYALTYDLTAPRFKVKSIGTDEMVLERVLPYIEEDTTVDLKPVTNPDYLNAEYAIGIIMIKDVYKILVPHVGPANPGGGTTFGVTPGLNGDFAWLNIQDRCENLLREKGFYFARYESFNKPEEWSDRAIAFLYKRCPQTEYKGCEPCDGGTAGWRVITAAEEIIGEDESADNVTQVEITVEDCFDCEAPAEMNIDYSGGTTSDVTAVMVSDAEAPTYVIAFETPGDWVSGSTIVAGTSAITCE